jgi:hypothetical protein
MDVDVYLRIHSFNDKKKKIKDESFNPLMLINASSGMDTKSGRMAAPNLDYMWLQRTQNADFWLDANDRGLEINKEIMTDINQLVFTEAGITAVGKMGGAPAVAGVLGGVVIANGLVYAQHYVNEKFINWYFD